MTRLWWPSVSDLAVRSAMPRISVRRVWLPDERERSGLPLAVAISAYAAMLISMVGMFLIHLNSHVLL